MRAEIAFGIALLVIGYNFIPVKAPEWLHWIAAIILLAIGCRIVIPAFFQVFSRWLSGLSR